MLFGAIIDYFCVETVLGSITNGLIKFFLGLVLGTSYVKFVEEKELLRYHWEAIKSN